MKCALCQHENLPTMKYCGECGARLIAVCTGCGAAIVPGQKFCGDCGQALPHEAAPLRLAPEGYTPKHLAEGILTSKGVVEGERKHVTVLFADIVDSSSLAQKLDPELMHAILDRVLRLMTEMVHRYDGTVNQYLGDGVMALFGAPLALENHAVRAVQAALGIRESIAAYSEKLKREHRVEVSLHLGLNSGFVVVGKIGDDLRMDYTAVGDTTHLAARIQQMAGPGTILLTEATHRLVEGYVRSESAGTVHVKGRSDLVPLFRVTGRVRRRSRFDITAETGLITLIGRAPEHAVLHDCLGRAVERRGQVVSIVGDAGIGKSRLVYEFRKSLGSTRVIWLDAHCTPEGRTTPYAPIVEILRTNFHIEEGDHAAQIEEKLRQGLRRVDGDLERILPSLCEVFGLPTDDTLQHLAPKERRQKAFDAIKTLTVVASERRPHVLVVEDLHWIDRTSEDYLASFIESIAGIPVLLITTNRPGYSVRWADKTYYTQIALDRLSLPDVDAMLERLLGTRDVPSDLVPRIYAKAEGNPLFVEEIVSSLRERQLLVPRGAGFVWAANAPVDFPGTVHDIVHARLDRLDEPVKRTVQTAAVIGRQFGLHLLARVSAMAAELESYLATLKRLELVHEARFLPEREYMFKHVVIQDAAYQSLLNQRRKILHGAIARAIEELYPDHLEEHAAMLAYHYARGEQPDNAGRYAVIAGDRAARVYANVEATAHYQHALDAARALPSTPETQRFEIDTVLKLAAVANTRDDFHRARTTLLAARAVAERLEERPRLAHVLYWIGRIEYVLGKTGAAIEHAERSLDVAERIGDDALTAPPMNLLGRLYWQQGSLGQAIDLLERSTEQMLRLGNLNDAATTAGFAGIALADSGALDRAFARAEQGLQLAKKIQNPFAQAAAHYYRGHVHSNRGHWATALDDFREGRRIAEGVGDHFRIYTLKVYEGRAHTFAGDPARGRVVLEECIAIAEQFGTTLFLSRPKAFLAECLCALGDLDAAANLAHEAARLAGEAGERHGQALAHRALAETFRRRSPPDVRTAEAMLLEAIKIQEENGEGPELARSYVHYADLLAVSGQQRKAREVLSKAQAMFRDMGMTWDLERTTKESRRVAESAGESDDGA